MRRDLSAFQEARTISVAPPPAPPTPASSSQRPEGGPAKSRSPKRASRPERPSTPAEAEAKGRHKTTVSIPVLLHAGLREATEERDCFKADVVMDAYDRFADRLRKEQAKKGGRRTRSGRRRRVADPTPCQLYLTGEERHHLDALAAELGGVSRSALVTTLLQLELAGVDVESS
jgi:hypothetical protein